MTILISAYIIHAALYLATPFFRYGFPSLSFSVIPAAANSSAAIGIIQLKNANGRYCATLIFSVVAINTPHVFHGINADVTVPAFSSVEDDTVGRRFILSYSSAYMRPGMTIEMYCSGMVALENMADIWLPGLLKTFHQSFPNIEFELMNSENYAEIESWICHGQVDFVERAAGRV